MKTITFSCDQCLLQGAACADCVVPLFCEAPEQVVLTAADRQALQVLASEELVPPLRLVTTKEEYDKAGLLRLAG
ncbi:MAG: hypothetical protein LBH11_01955 [Propionibacteriaceae bacterium]|jgi:hypothetical protein|nr:hypothetical protein [Propionibacteriaceae bacterium]